MVYQQAYENQAVLYVRNVENFPEKGQAIAKACFVGRQELLDRVEDLVKQAADYVTSSNDEDGIAEALEKFIF